jgi:glycerophosphoryl diester phosphodiesterase
MSRHRIHPIRPAGRTLCAAVVAAAVAIVPAVAHSQSARNGAHLAGRAVLPVDTYAPGPPSGSALVPAGETTTVINGVRFPTPSQPVEGFSGIIAGGTPGEYLAMPDNGFGGKANSRDFLIRAYSITPDFEDARGGSGTVAVGDHIQFSDPDGVIGFDIVRAGTPERWLTGGDVDPESIQRDHRGDLWMGDEFGPWILHFDATGRLLEPPIELPGLRSPNNPFLSGSLPTVANSRGLEAMAMTPNGRHLVAVLEGAVPGDDASNRRVYRYDIAGRTFTRLGDYRVEAPGNFVADAQSVDGRRLLVIERDGGLGLTAAFRAVYLVDVGTAGTAADKTAVVDLTAIPDPDLVSLPPIHAGDVGLGDPFRVTCESIEALHVISHARLLLGCDNNFPNTGRNPGRADDTELIVVDVPGL